MVSTTVNDFVKIKCVFSLAAIEGKGLSEIKPPAGAFIQFACAANQTIKDALESDRNSLFTKHLLKNITRENVDFTDIFRDITDDVYKESIHKQRPLSMNGFQEHRQIYFNEVIKPIERELSRSHIKCLTLA
jgi:hypothetical protein